LLTRQIEIWFTKRCYFCQKLLINLISLIDLNSNRLLSLRVLFLMPLHNISYRLSWSNFRQSPIGDLLSLLNNFKMSYGLNWIFLINILFTGWYLMFGPSIIHTSVTNWPHHNHLILGKLGKSRSILLFTTRLKTNDWGSSSMFDLNWVIYIIASKIAFTLLEHWLVHESIDCTINTCT
jgi:hypothetical protein